MSEFGRLTRVLVKHVREAFVSQEVIDAQWASLNFSSAPDFTRAMKEYDAFLEIVATGGAEIVQLPREDGVNLDSIYTRDASVVCDGRSMLCRMGKSERSAEPDAQARTLGAIGWPVAGRIMPPGRLEGGDLIWLHARALAVGLGYRTDAEGVAQLRRLLGHDVEECSVVPLPHWRGPGDVMHLMSLVSPVDEDLAVVYSRLLPVPFRRQLLERGYRLIEVPDEEFDTMGANVLALAPRVCVLVRGNPRTRALLERAGATVYEYEGQEISLKGGGGPTCLTRPLLRDDGRAVSA